MCARVGKKDNAEARFAEFGQGKHSALRLAEIERLQREHRGKGREDWTVKIGFSGGTSPKCCAAPDSWVNPQS